MMKLGELLKLEGKVAIVTGGAMGIGEAIAARLAEAGAAVVVADLNEEAAGRAAETIKTNGGVAEAVPVDVADVAGAKRLVDRASDRFGGVDILVNNAGIFPFSPALEVTPELWDKVLGVNLRGAFFLAQAAARAMKPGGSIVNIASIDALHPTGNLVHYDASKAALVMLTKALALELGPRGIRVNAVAPGGISTPGAAAQSAAVLKATGAPVEALMNAFLARIPLRRLGEPDDIARVVLFLAGPGAAYMTGALVVVDGGYLLS